MPKYLVGDPTSMFEERDFFVTDANSQEEAIDRYIRAVTIHDDTLTEHLCGKSTNMSFAAGFWAQTEEEDEAFNERGEILIDDEEFKRRVRVFFGEHQDYADIYLNHYFSDIDDENCDPDLFPDEMRLYIVENSNWTSVEAIPLDEIEEL